MEKKVFCKGCKYKVAWEGSMGLCGYECHCPAYTVISYSPTSGKLTHFSECDEVNKNCDCQFFESVGFFDKVSNYFK
jgi:hypothetical protein